ncbi:hypothetical protein ACWCO0_16570 [Streptomyces tubercidicus]|uniref:hypothetical protein n=1 Tax=Streptomyces tubercidicus TaxID=47759 RepID=UPI0013573345|nr:hypothetical protein [Streptomyces tubercidicus]WAU12429.1 hypothetical protein STRTU_002772 [Streptomyces tubercidicus]
MTTPDRTSPVEVAEPLHHAPAPDGVVEFGSSSCHVEDASPEVLLSVRAHSRLESRCPDCAVLERGRKQAEADRDPSKVTDFNVLIVRHRMTHPAGP